MCVISKIAGLSRLGAPLFSVDVHPDGSRLVVGGADKSVSIWSISGLFQFIQSTNQQSGEQKTMLCTQSIHGYPVNCTRFSPNGRFLVSAADDFIIMVSQLDTNSPPYKDLSSGLTIYENWKPCCRLAAHRNSVTDISWSPCGNYFASCSFDQTVIIWQLSDSNSGTFTLYKTLLDHGSFVKGVAWDPQGRYLITQCDGGELRIFSTTSFQCVAILEEPFDPSAEPFFYRTSWSPDGTLIAGSCGLAKQDHFVDISSCPIIQRGHFDPSAKSPLGNRSWKRQIDLIGTPEHTVSTQWNPRVFHSQNSTLNDPYSKDDVRMVVACGSNDSVLSVWNTKSCRPIFLGCFELFKGPVFDIAWSPDGMNLFAVGGDGTLVVVQFTQKELGYPLSDKSMKVFFQDQIIEEDSDIPNSLSNLDQSRLNLLSNIPNSIHSLVSRIQGGPRRNSKRSVTPTTKSKTKKSKKKISTASKDNVADNVADTVADTVTDTDSNDATSNENVELNSPVATENSKPPSSLDKKKKKKIVVALTRSSDTPPSSSKSNSSPPKKKSRRIAVSIQSANSTLNQSSTHTLNNSSSSSTLRQLHSHNFPPKPQDSLSNHQEHSTLEPTIENVKISSTFPELLKKSHQFLQPQSPQTHAIFKIDKNSTFQFKYDPETLNASFLVQHIATNFTQITSSWQNSFHGAYLNLCYNTKHLVYACKNSDYSSNVFIFDINNGLQLGPTLIVPNHITHLQLSHNYICYVTTDAQLYVTHFNSLDDSFSRLERDFSRTLSIACNIKHLVLQHSPEFKLILFPSGIPICAFDIVAYAPLIEAVNTLWIPISSKLLLSRDGSPFLYSNPRGPLAQIDSCYKVFSSIGRQHNNSSNPVLNYSFNSSSIQEADYSTLSTYYWNRIEFLLRHFQLLSVLSSKSDLKDLSDSIYLYAKHLVQSPNGPQIGMLSQLLKSIPNTLPSSFALSLNQKQILSKIQTLLEESSLSKSTPQLLEQIKHLGLDKKNDTVLLPFLSVRTIRKRPNDCIESSPKRVVR